MDDSYLGIPGKLWELRRELRTAETEEKRALAEQQLKVILEWIRRALDHHQETTD
jgi:hypothetical protein